MKQNPFSLYDFLGYVFPGATVIFLCYFISYTPTITSIKLLKIALSELDTDFSLENTIFWILLAYIVGHLVAYLSSVTVERFTIWCYGYPSKFLLAEQTPHNMYLKIPKTKNEKKNKNGKTKEYTVIRIGIRLIVAIILLPISLGTLFFGKLCGLRISLVKKLDDVLVDAIKENQKYLLDFLHISTNNEKKSENEDEDEENIEEDGDFHRIVYHYVYEHQNHHPAKLDNYVALYGFLRAITLISNCAFMVLLVKALKSITFEDGYVFDLQITIYLIALFLITYVFFLAFIKFYRRFTLESYMSLVTDITHKKVEPINLWSNTTIVYSEPTTEKKESSIQKIEYNN
jgi:hypothetical protein